MSTSTELARLARLIAGQHGWPAAKSIKSFAMNDSVGAELSQCAVDLRKALASMPIESLAMSAAFAVALERRLDAPIPIHVVTGTLAVSGVPVLDDRKLPAGQAASGDIGAGRGGHTWVMIGHKSWITPCSRLPTRDRLPSN